MKRLINFKNIRIMLIVLLAFQATCNSALCVYWPLITMTVFLPTAFFPEWLVFEMFAGEPMPFGSIIPTILIIVGIWVMTICALIMVILKKRLFVSALGALFISDIILVVVYFINGISNGNPFPWLFIKAAGGLITVLLLVAYLLLHAKNRVVTSKPAGDNEEQKKLAPITPPRTRLIIKSAIEATVAILPALVLMIAYLINIPR